MQPDTEIYHVIDTRYCKGTTRHMQAELRQRDQEDSGSDSDRLVSGLSSADTPTHARMAYSDTNGGSEDFHNSVPGTAENPALFPAQATLKMHVVFVFGNSELFFSVANLTNHSNPIINTSDGFIYDTSILPSVGFQWLF